MADNNEIQNHDEQQIAETPSNPQPFSPANTLPPPPLIDNLPLYGNAALYSGTYSYARPFWYVALMTLISMGAYPVVWFYRAWKVILAEYNLKGNAVVNTIFILFCAIPFFRYAFSLGEKNGHHSTMSSNSAAALFIVVEILESVSSGIDARSDSLTIYSFITFVLMLLSLIPLREGTLAMNAAYANLQPNSKMRTTLSPWSIFFLIICTIIWLLSLSSLFMK